MNGLVIILIGIVALGAGYLFYGRWLAKNGALIRMPRLPLTPMRMARIMSRLPDLLCFLISFLPSQAPALSPVRS